MFLISNKKLINHTNLNQQRIQSTSQDLQSFGSIPNNNLDSRYNYQIPETYNQNLTNNDKKQFNNATVQYFKYSMFSRIQNTTNCSSCDK